jgi:hypothetical protein
MTLMDSNETSGELERDAEASRARLAMTLDQLRDNLMPQHIAEELLGGARDGASILLKAVGQTAAQNPVPALLVGAACAMFFSSAKNSATSLATDAPLADSHPLAAASGNKPSPRPEHAVDVVQRPTRESRWAILGERPIVTAIMGVVIGWSVAAVLPRAKTRVD